MQEPPNLQYLSITGIGETNRFFLRDLAQQVNQQSCQLISCRAFVHPPYEYTALLVAGSWDRLSCLEAQLTRLSEHHAFSLFFKRLEETPYAISDVPYIIYIHTVENPDIFHEVMHYFFHQGPIKLMDISAETYRARQTQCPMLAITVKLLLPARVSISEWRESLMLFCDDLNADVIMEPDRMY